jgi:hypothetical protein
LTLVEVLMAVVVLSIGIMGVLRAYAGSVTTLEAGQYTIDAVSLLKQKMSDTELMLLEKEEITRESDKGAFESPYEGFLWEWAIEPTEIEGLFTLTVNITHDYNPRSFTLRTYVLAQKAEEDEEE